MEIPSEIWTRGVFPFLSQESIVQCLPLFLVSREWYNMMCQVDTHVIVGKFDHMAYTILADRIGNSTKLLVANNNMIMYICTQYPNLEILRLIDQGPNNIVRYRVHGLEKLKSLTLNGIMPIGTDKLICLEHLSTTHLCMDGGLILPKNLKRLHIGPKYNNLLSCSVREILGLNLDYLEGEINIFWKLAYTGIGRASCDGHHPFSYEGEWLGGRYHGKGVISGPRWECSGEWIDNVIKYGTFIQYVGDIRAVYRGDLVDTGDSIRAHGQGKMTIGDRCYEGEFISGYYNNDKSLVYIGCLYKINL